MLSQQRAAAKVARRETVAVSEVENAAAEVEEIVGVASESRESQVSR
jgi:hypothetical protein